MTSVKVIFRQKRVRNRSCVAGIVSFDFIVKHKQAIQDTTQYVTAEHDFNRFQTSLLDQYLKGGRMKVSRCLLVLFFFSSSDLHLVRVAAAGAAGGLQQGQTLFILLKYK